MYYIIYKTTNKINGKYYIGMHKTDDLEDGYLGSGTYFSRALEKYGKENFEREILEYCNSDEEMHNAEARYITEDVVNDKKSYNLKLGGFGGWDYVNKILTVEEMKRRGKLGSIAFKEKLKDPEYYEKWHQMMVKVNASQSKRNKAGESLKEHWKLHGAAWTGKHHKESTKRKIGEANSKHQKGSGNSQYGTCWISNTLIKKSITIKKEFLFDYISEGWIKKRIIKW